MHTLRLFTTGVGLMLMAWGCTAPARSGDPTTYRFPADDAGQRQRLWDASGEVLRAHLFDLEVVDPRSGAMVTEPATSEHFFEFWRHDVATPYDFVEASMRTVRRTVIVQLAPVDAEDENDARLVVTVQREYLSTPERQFNSSVAAFQMFATNLPRADTGRRIRPEDTSWIDAGRDVAMERYLRERILERADLSFAAGA